MSLEHASKWLGMLSSDAKTRSQFLAQRGNVIGFQTALKAAGLAFTAEELRKAHVTVATLASEVEALVNEVQGGALQYLEGLDETGLASDYYSGWQRQTKG